MQIYDIVMIAVLAIATIFGAIKGFAWQIASLASIIVSYIVAYTFRNDVAKMIHAQEPWNGFLAMLLLYAGSSFVIWVIFRLISSAIDGVRLRDFDRHMGALLGLAKGAVYCLLITMFAVSLLGPKQQQAIVNSRSGGYISKMLAATDGIMWPKEIEQVVRPYLNNVEKKFDQRQNGMTADGSSGEYLPSGFGNSEFPNGKFLSKAFVAGGLLPNGSQQSGSMGQGGDSGFGQESFGLQNSGLPGGFIRSQSVPVSTPNWTDGWFPQRAEQSSPTQSAQPTTNPFNSQEFLP